MPKFIKKTNDVIQRRKAFILIEIPFYDRNENK